MPSRHDHIQGIRKLMRSSSRRLQTLHARTARTTRNPNLLLRRSHVNCSQRFKPREYSNQLWILGPTPYTATSVNDAELCTYIIVIWLIVAAEVTVISQVQIHYKPMPKHERHFGLLLGHRLPVPDPIPGSPSSGNWDIGHIWVLSVCYDGWGSGPSWDTGQPKPWRGRDVGSSHLFRCDRGKIHVQQAL